MALNEVSSNEIGALMGLSPASKIGHDVVFERRWHTCQERERVPTSE